MRYRLVNLTPNPLLDTRYSIGALVHVGQSLCSAPAAPLPRELGKTAILADHLQRDLHLCQRFDNLPTSFGPLASLGKIWDIPSDIAIPPVLWVTHHVLQYMPLFAQAAFQDVLHGKTESRYSGLTLGECNQLRGYGFDVDLWEDELFRVRKRA